MSYEVKYSNRVDYDTESLAERISVFANWFKKLMDSSPNIAAKEATDALIRTGVINRDEIEYREVDE